MWNIVAIFAQSATGNSYSHLPPDLWVERAINMVQSLNQVGSISLKMKTLC